MLNLININSSNIIHEIKLTCQLPSLIEGIINRKIIAKIAAEKGITATQEELQQGADNLRIINHLHHAEDTWKWLEKHHLSVDDFEEIVYSNVISAKLAQHLFADSIEPFFVEHQLDYAGVVFYEVILNDQDLALELFYAITEKEISFAEVASQYIEDPELRRCGGYRGILHRKDLKPEISAAVFAATPPQLLKPIVASKGVHLIFVEEIIQPQLDDELRYQLLSDLFSEWLKQQIAKSEVNVQIESTVSV
ncbi:peptidylprolyl isomerase [Gloeocapsopsis dulcis]|uniref:peptidylprolyl isomerase n=1 Tax=Gloeocapsopsis dulcis AAB1 = 1H9 TaxID=1433147 RepID=A0A6N8FS67_9CHRO|nr:peptidylprolyl isomerase [Gloeocapsopsis dulcis]MUL35791.1 peptidylprolyl isomerase [Gloeocapsopsis dulcis AAB1 = 1H9]WNN90925.1 peptidylprolyl isomerase [Gloeocapsopsis dulcis]